MSSMDEGVKLSIIVPAYKVEAYIEKCIRSLEDQDLPKEEYEIIVINDGSPDRCREIVEDLQKEFNNIILINQVNQGVSVARNNGIVIAQGKYIMPIDPDDYVLSDTLASIIERAEKNELDILYCGFDILDQNNLKVWSTNYSTQENVFYDGVEGYFASRGYDVKDPDRSVAIMIRRDLINWYKILYPKDVPYLEDGLFLAKVFTVAQKVGFSDKKFYQRTTRMGSATNSNLFFSDKAVKGFIYSLKDLKNFTNDNYLSIKQLELINHVMSKYIFLSLKPSIYNFDLKGYLTILKQLNDAGFNKLNSEGIRFNYKKYIKIYNKSKILFFFYIKLMRK